MLIEFLLKKVELGEIDPYDVNICSLIEEFRVMSERLSSEGMLRLAGTFFLASVKLLKYKLEYFFPQAPHKKERRNITLEEVKEVLRMEEDDPYEYFVSVGRKAGSKNKNIRHKSYSLQTEPEPIPLHKAMNPEEYMKALKELNLYDFEDFKNFFYSLKDPLERVRFFIAWLSINDLPEPVFS